MRNHKGSLSVLSILVLSVLFVSFNCQAMPSPSPGHEMLIKHKWDAIPDAWVCLGQPPNGTTIKLHIALKADRDNALTDALYEVSHPRHPRYIFSRILIGTRLAHVFVSDMVRTYQGSRLLR